MLPAGRPTVSRGGRPKGSRNVLPLGTVALIRDLRRLDPDDPEARELTEQLLRVMREDRPRRTLGRLSAARLLARLRAQLGEWEA